MANTKVHRIDPPGYPQAAILHRDSAGFEITADVGGIHLMVDNKAMMTVSPKYIKELGDIFGWWT